MAFPYPYKGPIALFNNLPISSQNYNPNQFVISNITLGVQTVVTTSVNHNYVIGQLVRLIVPPAYGSRQLNETEGYVLSIPALNQVSIAIDSSQNVDTFISAGLSNLPQILAIGDINQGQINPARTGQNLNIPGSFINVSP